MTVLVLAIVSAVVSPSMVWWAGERAIRARRRRLFAAVSEWVARDVHTVAHVSDGSAEVRARATESVVADLLRLAAPPRLAVSGWRSLLAAH